jgi:hypothetical protein
MKNEETIKPSNFGPHVNLGLFFPEVPAIIKTRPTANEDNGSCRKTEFRFRNPVLFMCGT